MQKSIVDMHLGVLFDVAALVDELLELFEEEEEERCLGLQPEPGWGPTSEEDSRAVFGECVTDDAGNAHVGASAVFQVLDARLDDIDRCAECSAQRTSTEARSGLQKRAVRNHVELLENALEKIVRSELRNVHHDGTEDVGRKTSEQRRRTVILDDADESVDAVLVAVSCVFGQIQVRTHPNQDDLGRVANHTSYSTCGSRAQRELSRGRRFTGTRTNARLHILVYREARHRIRKLTQQRRSQAVPKTGDAFRLN